MHRLSELCSNVRTWNIMGYNLLPSLELAFILTPQLQPLLSNILLDLQPYETLFHQQSSSHEIYKLIKFVGNAHMTLHLLIGLNQANENITDQIFKRRKHWISKIRNNHDIIFITPATEHPPANNPFNNQLTKIKDIQINNNTNLNDLYHHIIKTYQTLSKFELIGNYKSMLDLQKTLQKQLNRYQSYKSAINREISIDAYGFNTFHSYQKYMISSLEGTYYNRQEWMKQQSLRWQIMELFENILEMEGQQLIKKLDSMPLSFIELKYKMSSDDSIAGFLSDTCFHNIFSPILSQLTNIIIETLSAFKYKILNRLQLSLNYYFIHLNILNDYLQKQYESVQKLINTFLQQSSKNIQSQIKYIYAPSQHFWEHRKIQSSLYGAQQQIYIEIKYIGKSYITKIYQNLKQTIPRYIGQNLLHKLILYFQNQSFANLLSTIWENPFQIISSQQSVFLNLQQNLLKVNKLLNYFSLKINSSLLIKNYHQKNNKQWNHIFGISSSQSSKNIQDKQPKGIIFWIKNLFGKSKDNHAKKRTKSLQRKNISTQQVTILHKQKQPTTINSKQWLLIINTHRTIDSRKLQYSCKEGFPKRLRSSIWTYLAHQNNTQSIKSIKVKQLLQKKPKNSTRKQIQLDVLRTYPHKLFKGYLKQSLQRVLEAYSLYDQQIGYTQGMNFIGSVIMCTLIGYGQQQLHYIDMPIAKDNSQLQQKTFDIFQYLMIEKGLRKMLFVERQTLVDLCWRLQQIIKKRNQQIHLAIKSTGMTTEMIFSSPIISSLSASQMNPSIIRRVFDIIMVLGFSVVYKIIAQFIICAEKRVLQLHQTDQLYNYLREKVYDEVYSQIGQTGLTQIFKNL